MGVWGFNPDYLTGIYLLNQPLEEVLFFICIPYACLFTYFVYKKYVSPESIAFLKQYPLFFLMLLSLVGVIFFHNKLYTFYTALFLLISLVGVWRMGYNLHFTLITYITILPFFYTSNGLLTGSFLDAPIVWYDNNENLGLRMFTIPLEDLFYGFLLFMLNVLLYEGIKARARPDKGKNRNILV
ncbi:MAG: lycopene cyclase domain-containing protein [Bacteroidetes bacterium]|nr:MAG: lycopene cyclase domain-containing protein [Bacteroidota bacterium]